MGKETSTTTLNTWRVGMNCTEYLVVEQPIDLSIKYKDISLVNEATKGRFSFIHMDCVGVNGSL